MIVGLDGLEAEAVGHEAELLEGFAGLELGGGESGIGGEGFAIVAVDAEVAPVGAAGGPLRHRDAAKVGDGASGEVKGFAGFGADDLDDAVAGEAGGVGQAADGGDEAAAGLGVTGGEGVDQRRLDEGFVALDVDEEVAGELFEDAGEAEGAVGAGGIGHQDVGPEAAGDAGDLIAVGQDDDGGGEAGFTGAIPDVLEDGEAAEVEEDFAGEARRRQTSRNCQCRLKRRTGSGCHGVDGGARSEERGARHLLRSEEHRAKPGRCEERRAKPGRCGE
jgi:hypothetical protein